MTRPWRRREGPQGRGGGGDLHVRQPARTVLQVPPQGLQLALQVLLALPAREQGCVALRLGVVPGRLEVHLQPPDLGIFAVQQASLRVHSRGGSQGVSGRGSERKECLRVLRPLDGLPVYGGGWVTNNAQKAEAGGGGEGAGEYEKGARGGGEYEKGARGGV